MCVAFLKNKFLVAVLETKNSNKKPRKLRGNKTHVAAPVVLQYGNHGSLVESVFYS
jgi:hypothetical protein